MLAPVLSSLCMEVLWGGPPPNFLHFPSISISSVHPVYPCTLNPTLNYPTIGSQCSKMDLIIIISASQVHLGTAAFSTATRRRVSVEGGVMGPLWPNCFRQVKERGGRMCSCAPHIPGSASAGIVSWGRRGTAVIFRVCSTFQSWYLIIQRWNSQLKHLAVSVV